MCVYKRLYFSLFSNTKGVGDSTLKARDFMLRNNKNESILF